MSMIGHLRQVSDQCIDHLLAYPEAVYEIIDAESDDPDAAYLNLDKAWHGIHYLLTGDAWGGTFPEGFLVTGGMPIGEEDVGYGPARSFRAAEVARIATELAMVDDQTFCDRCSPDRLQAAEIYPTVGEDARVEVCTYLLTYFQQLRAFVQQAAAAQQGLLIYLD